MKKSTVILGIVSVMTLCLTACGKPNMSFEEAIDNVTHSELKEIMANAENYEQNFNISSNFSVKEDNVEAKISLSTNSKQNVKNSEWETKISLKVDASWDGDEWRENIKLDWEAVIKSLKDAVYFKLSSLNLDGPEEFTNEFDSALPWIKNQWFSFELTDEIKEKLYAELPEDFDLNNLNSLKDDEALNKLAENLKKSINNEWAVVYSGIYSEFEWYNARKFSINKEKAFDSFMEYVKWIIPEEYAGEIDEINAEEIFDEDFPLKNFEWYLVITWKDRVQVVIENLDIENDYSSSKINWTYGRDRYELVVKNEWKEVFVSSAKLNGTHYDILMKVQDSEIIKWTITPRKSDWKISIDFDLSINFVEGEDKTIIPLQGWWSREEISKFNVEVPKNSKNLLEDIMKNIDLDAADLQWLSLGSQWYWSSMLPAWILAAALAPRMQSAQDRARDVSRKTALSQIQSAIIVSQMDEWMRPGIDAWAEKWITVSKIKNDLIHAGMSSVPSDPVKNNENYWLWKNYKNNSATWEYLYLVAKRNWVQNGWFVLMAKTEVEWWSNRVVCKDWNWLSKWYLANSTDIAKIQLCNTISKWDSCGINEGNCTYTDNDELRYIMIY